VSKRSVLRDKISTLYYLVRANVKAGRRRAHEYLNLRPPIYRKTAPYGHVRRKDPTLPGKRPTKRDSLRAAWRNSSRKPVGVPKCTESGAAGRPWGHAVGSKNERLAIATIQETYVHHARDVL